MYLKVDIHVALETSMPDRRVLYPVIDIFLIRIRNFSTQDCKTVRLLTKKHKSENLKHLHVDKMLILYLVFGKLLKDSSLSNWVISVL